MNDTLTPVGDASSAPKTVDVVVVGAGFGGLYATHQFHQMGLSVQGIEAGQDVGGVWYWNRYPGARVDVMSIDYSYSFSNEIAQAWNWSEQFAAQPEVLKYIHFVADKLALRQHYQFNARVKSARWNEEDTRWIVTTDSGDIYHATYCVMATGPLSVPNDPDVPGLDTFAGELYRPAKWPQTPVDFTGKRVGVIGVGSTGIQIVQEIGPRCGELYVFQRTPSFTMPMRNTPLSPAYIAEVKRNYPALHEIGRNSPYAGLRPTPSRAFFSATPNQRQSILEDAWQQGGLAVFGAFSDLMTNAEANEAVADFVRGKIGEIVADPVTAEKLKPRGYPIFARRPCVDSGYYETFNLPHVHLVDCHETPVLEVTPAGIRTSAGGIALDMLILATGYDGLTGALQAFDVVGRNGLHITDKWKHGARSYMGLMMRGFPNLFMTTGPNGPAALANVVRTSEHDVDWIAGVIAHMRRHAMASAEPDQAAEDDWMELVREMAQKTLMSKAKTWYVGANVRDKPQGLTLFTGGFHKYRELCAAVAHGGYRTLAFETARELETA